MSVPYEHLKMGEIEYRTKVSFDLPMGLDFSREDITNILSGFSIADYDTRECHMSLLGLPQWFLDAMRETQVINKVQDVIDWMHKNYPEREHGLTVQKFSNGHWYVHGRGQTDLDCIADVIFRTMKHYKSKQCFYFEYSYDCNVPIPGAFAGGAVFITAEGIEWLTTTGWIEEKLNEFDEKTVPGLTG